MTNKQLQIEILNETKTFQSASLFEKVLGYLSIFMLVLQCWFKINSQKLIFILSPCHIILLFQAYILINPNNLTERTIYTVIMNTLFSPWFAIAFPVTCGLDGFLEIPMFWIEHFMAALINPLVLNLSHRYYTKNTISVRNHLLAHLMIGFYQRIVLFPLSQATHVNLNFTLCPYINDPFEPLLGKWYYIASDYYIFIGGEIFHRIIKFLLNGIKKLEHLIFHKSSVAEYESQKNK
jgi:hypothetical protein